MINLIGKYYIRYSIYTGAGYSSPVASQEITVSPSVIATPNNDNKTITFNVDGEGGTVHYCIENGAGCVEQTATPGVPITASGNQCVRYYITSSGDKKSLEEKYCFY